MFRFLRDNATWAAGLAGLTAIVLVGLLVAALRPHPATIANDRPASEGLRNAGPPPALAGDAVPALIFENLTPQQALAVNIATPVSSEPIIPARPVKVLFATPVDHDRAVNCLTQAIYYEAGYESLQGRRAVAQVVLNRMKNNIFPKTICGVVFQGADLPTGCQFTFSCDGSLLKTPNPLKWTEAKAIAEAALNGLVEKSVGHATHYHTAFVVPYWMPTLTKLVQIGGHIFYRWPGAMGAPRAFEGAYAGGEPLEPGAPLPPPEAAAEAAPVPPVPPQAAAVIPPVATAPPAAAGAPVAVVESVTAPVEPTAAPPVAPPASKAAPPPTKPDWFGTDRLRALRAARLRKAEPL